LGCRERFFPYRRARLIFLHQTYNTTPVFF
jgi:hypothetical protein